MRISRTAFLLSFPLLAITLLNACSSSIKYGSDFRVNTDFVNFKTYSWHAPNEFNEVSNNYIANDLVTERIEANIDMELAKKGYTKVDSGAVDFLVNYSITAEDKIDIRSYNTYSGYGAGWGGGYYGHMGSPYGYYGLGYGAPMTMGTETRVTQYQQGTFVLDIIDVQEDTLVWRGTAEGRMSNTELTPEERNEDIAMIISEVLIGFPPE